MPANARTVRVGFDLERHEVAEVELRERLEAWQQIIRASPPAGAAA